MSDKVKTEVDLHEEQCNELRRDVFLKYMSLVDFSARTLWCVVRMVLHLMFK